ncbi:probable disease resistance RF45 isoform X1 [Olea europaea subsp. europaea]|uniref:Probable disease resistance RF45 isoform X1 n=1 Tax=Olea europaea subsp. europaea TaxID=158383 RepID=A0A8S0TB94_OLEEU|nr:probable disease resistance RF45 isoform X1 [Olea europaea subsp. europaea]
MGLPSAIVAVGEVLAKKRTSHEWEMMLRDIKLLIDRGQPIEQILSQKSILDLIFDDLPYHLKPCFRYLGLFPKGSKIEVEHLYLQWMAEGMISRDDCQENEMMMDLAERYLSDLVQRKIVEVEEEEEIPSLRKYKSCQVHEHVKDYCLQKREEYFFEVLDNRSSDSISLTTNPARGMALHLGKEDDRSSVDQLRNGKLRHLSMTVEGNLGDLKQLVCRMDMTSENTSVSIKIAPHYEITKRLTEMVLIGSQLKEDPMTTLDKLPELQVLVLQNDAFDRKKMVCVESSFMKLKRLELSTLRFLET